MIMMERARFIVLITIPAGRCKFTTSVASEKDLLLYSNKKQTPVSLKALMETGKDCRLPINNNIDEYGGAIASKSLVQVACFLHRELPVRLAHNAVKFEASPLIMKSGKSFDNC